VAPRSLRASYGPQPLDAARPASTNASETTSAKLSLYVIAKHLLPIGRGQYFAPKQVEPVLSSGNKIVDPTRKGREDGAVDDVERFEDRVETVGDRLKRLRKERGLTQRELSVPGVSYAHISRIERGGRSPSIKALRKLALKLGVTAEYLETGHEAPQAQLLELRLRDAELALRLTDDAHVVERELPQIVEDARAAGDAVIATRGAGLLGLAALRKGDHTEAVAVLEPVVADVSAAEHPDLVGALARSYVGLGRSDDGVTLLEDALAEVEQAAPDNAILAVRYATLLSYALSEIGDLSAAREAVAYALQRAEETDDSYTRVRTHWSDARLAAVGGDPQAALASLERAVTLLEATEDVRQLGRAHLLWAETLTFDNRAREALSHLKTAEHLLGRSPDTEDRYWLRTEQARAAAQLGWHEEAIHRAQEALRLIGDTDPAEQGAACFALGEALAKKGEIGEGAAALRRAVDLLVSQRLWREAAAAATVLADALTAAGREDEAVEIRVQLERELLPRLQQSASTRMLRLPVRLTS
jgi:transcriptional regulator with XRE-family HTH domain